MTALESVLPEAIATAVTEPERLRRRISDRLAYASDASHFLVTPTAVAVAADAGEVGAVMRAASRAGMPVTFRSGGTSLSGQASGSGLLVDVRQRFRAVTVLDEGRRVRVEPGATVRQVNAHLARFGTRLGPDPASEAACTIGGVVANNSSGMACGTTQNTYCTLESLVAVLPSGTVVDTGATDADTRLRAQEPALVAGLERLRDRVRTNPHSVAVIERHFALKNTMGYGLNAFLDFTRPAELLAHLLVGSEGTLGFVAEATFRTVPLRTEVVSALALFPDLAAATAALPALVATGAATLELMDATSLRVGQRLPGVPSALLGWEVRDEAALLIEYRAESAEELADLRTRGDRALASPDVHLVHPATLTTNAAERAAAWKFRKGLYASVAGARPSGTTALLEDIAVPVPTLAATCAQLQAEFARYGYADSVIFGHAKDGNIHFMLTDRFEADAAVQRYLGFTDAMVDLVLAAGGNLKAEHGTGRAMAPYVRRQYGDELYDVMCELKRLCDPQGILNPGVILDDDPDAHVRNLKLAPTVDAEVDRCVECGYCEPVCPSRDLTLTPRQRIVLRRATERARQAGDHALVTELEHDYRYDGVHTCAVDGMCETACPVHINTGALVKRLRGDLRNPVLDAGFRVLADGWGMFSRAASLGMTVADALPGGLVRGASNLGRAVLGADTVPQVTGDLPRGGASRRKATRALRTDLNPERPEAPRGVDSASAIYLPACVNSMFGPTDIDGLGATAAFVALLQRAGVRVLVPDHIDALCCGTPWSSKGFRSGHDRMGERVLAAVRALSPDQSLPVLTDASSCTEGFSKTLSEAGYTVEDAVAFTARVLLPRLTVRQQIDCLVLHPTCSSTQLGLNPALETVARAVACGVVTPVEWGCCAFAGDRGMLHPELTAAATAPEAAEVRTLHADAHASCNRTCEIGMERATGVPYAHVLELLERATRPS